MAHTLELIALAASIIMPLWNIPLIVRIYTRRSSSDLSLPWAWGVWVCMLFMVPWAVLTHDVVLKVFSWVNFILFSGVVFSVMKFRNGEKA
ncbi:MAG: hypothetical protein HQL19_07355 [Candidatus Omnitrophica bacterium]|nr:hypothetical protein [Candidatus Omnitrophota bacterium]